MSSESGGSGQISYTINNGRNSNVNLNSFPQVAPPYHGNGNNGQQQQLQPNAAARPASIQNDQRQMNTYNYPQQPHQQLLQQPHQQLQQQQQQQPPPSSASSTTSSQAFHLPIDACKEVFTKIKSSKLDDKTLVDNLWIYHSRLVSPEETDNHITTDDVEMNPININNLRNAVTKLHNNLLKYGRTAMQLSILSSFQKQCVTVDGQRIVNKFEDCAVSIKNSTFFDIMLAQSPLALVFTIYRLVYHHDPDTWLYPYMMKKLQRHNPPLSIECNYESEKDGRHRRHEIMTAAMESSRKMTKGLDKVVLNKWGWKLSKRDGKKTNSFVEIDISNILKEDCGIDTHGKVLLLVDKQRHPAFVGETRLTTDDEKRFAISNLLVTNRVQRNMQKILMLYHCTELALDGHNDDEMVDEFRQEVQNIKKSLIAGNGIASKQSSAKQVINPLPYKVKPIIDNNSWVGILGMPDDGVGGGMNHQNYYSYQGGASVGGRMNHQNYSYQGGASVGGGGMIHQNYSYQGVASVGGGMNHQNYSYQGGASVGGGMNHQNYSYEGGAGFPNNQGAGVDFHNNKDDPFANDDRESQGNRPNNQGAGVDFHNNKDDPIANDNGESQVGNPNNQGGADFHNQDDPIANDDGEIGLDGEALIDSLQTDYSESGEDDDSDDDSNGSFDEDEGKEREEPSLPKEKAPRVGLFQTLTRTLTKVGETILSPSKATRKPPASKVYAVIVYVFVFEIFYICNELDITCV